LTIHRVAGRLTCRIRSCGGQRGLLPDEALQTLPSKLMGRVGLAADVAHHPPASAAALADLVHRDAKAVARRHAAADDGCAVGTNDDAVVRPARGGEIKGARADVSLELHRTTQMRKAERLGIDRPTSNKNGQATPGPAVPVESGVHVDHQALSQTAYLPGMNLQEPNMMLRSCRALGTTSGALLGWRHLRAHGVVAAVDVEELARGHVQVVGEQRARGPADGSAVLKVPPEGRPQPPDLLTILEAWDAAGGQGSQRPGADRIGANLVATKVAGEVARHRLERRFRHAHPVVLGPRLRGV